MYRIKLIVTGVMEKTALPKVLAKFFPEKLNGKDVVWEEARQGDGITGYPLPAFATEPARASLQLAKNMITEARAGKQGKPADLVIVLDDVELGNLGREANIAAHFRAAVEKEIKALKLLAADETALRNTIQSKCSFHLIKPMIEAYLFADCNALQKAGMTTKPSLCHATDVEQFEANGPPGWVTQCRAENQKKATDNKAWWREECHPKHYLSYFNPDYEETAHGVSALLALDLQKMVQASTDAPLFCALIQDLADWFCIQNPLISTTTPCPNYYPAKTIRRNTLLLRNM